MKKFVFISVVSFLLGCKQANKMDKKILSDLDQTLEKSKGLPIDSIKVNITSDNTPDYLIFDESDHNSPVLIFDGKTGAKIKYEYEFIGQNFSVETLDMVNCKNPTKVLSILHKKKNRQELNILQYNSSNNSMDVIFSYPILISEWDNSIEKIKEVNYIDLIYSKKQCADTITISKGKLISEDADIHKIKPLSKEKNVNFIYNEIKNKFEKIVK